MTVAATYEEKENQMSKIEFLSELIIEANAYHNKKYIEVKVPERGELCSRNQEPPPTSTQVIPPVTPFKLEHFEEIPISKLLKLKEKNRYTDSRDLESWHEQVKNFETESFEALKVCCSACCKTFNRSFCRRARPTRAPVLQLAR